MNARGRLARWIFACAMLVLTSQVAAHETRFTRLMLDMGDDGQALLSVEFDVLDLELAVGLDSDADGSILWYEYEDKRGDIEDYIKRSLQLESDGQSCQLQALRESGGIRPGKVPSLLTRFNLVCGNELNLLSLNHQLLTNIDQASSVLLKISGSGADKSMVLEPGFSSIELGDTGFFAANISFVEQGIYHILIGIDHLAFLLLLILPAARRGNLRDSLVSIAGIVTAFTLAHSVTLALSATGYLSLPSKSVEVVIAASVVLAGIINLIRPRHRMGWMIAYSFGLVHGFGFAGALAELDIAQSLRLVNLASFNIGVELGQVALVVLTLPLLRLLGSKEIYSRYTVRLLSLVCAAAGSFWMLQRLA